MRFLMILRNSGMAALAAAALVLGAQAAQAQDVVPAARDALPQEIRAAGVLKIATSLQWAPFAYKSEAGAMVGIDISLMTLLSAKLGLKPEFEDIKFPSIVPGVSTGRYDVGVNQIGITQERAKVVDFVPYFNSGYGLLVRAGRKDVDINHLCGRSLALTQGSAQIAIAEELSAKCVADGQKAITMTFYPNSADTYMAVANGRGDGFMTAKAVGVHIARGNAKLEMTEPVLPGRMTLSGIVIGKGSTALGKALTLALESALADGSYPALMAEYGVSDGALRLEQIQNPPQF